MTFDEQGQVDTMDASSSLDPSTLEPGKVIAGRYRLGSEVGLTPREVEVLSLIAQGMSNLEIAEGLYLSINSVKTYIRSAYAKIGATSRSRAVAWCLQHGFSPPAEREAGE